MVFGGYNDHTNPVHMVHQDVEVINLSGDGKTCTKPPDYDMFRGTTGAYFNGYATMCGGCSLDGTTCMGTNPYTRTLDCFKYEPDSNSWSVAFQTLERRLYAAGVLLNDNEWWMAGGGMGSQQTTEIVNAGSLTSTAAIDVLPTWYQDGGLKMATADDDRVIVHRDSNVLDRTYVFHIQAQNFEKLPDKPELKISPQVGKCSKSTIQAKISILLFNEINSCHYVE